MSSLDAIQRRLEKARSLIAAQALLYRHSARDVTYIDDNNLYFCQVLHGDGDSNSTSSDTRSAQSRKQRRRWWLISIDNDGVTTRKMPLFNHDEVAALSHASADSLPVERFRLNFGESFIFLNL